MELSANYQALAYLVSAILFVLALKGLTHPATARRGNYMAMAGMVIAIVATLAFVITPETAQADPDLALLLWLGFGFFGTSGIVAYAVLSQAFPPHLAGRVNTSVNMLVFVLAFLGQWGLGIVIDLFPPAPGGGYAPEAYRASLGLIASLQAAGVLWYVAYRRARFPDVSH